MGAELPLVVYSAFSLTNVLSDFALQVRPTNQLQPSAKSREERVPFAVHARDFLPFLQGIANFPWAAVLLCLTWNMTTYDFSNL